MENVIACQTAVGRCLYQLSRISAVLLVDGNFSVCRNRSSTPVDSDGLLSVMFQYCYRFHDGSTEISDSQGDSRINMGLSGRWSLSKYVGVLSDLDSK